MPCIDRGVNDVLSVGVVIKVSLENLKSNEEEMVIADEVGRSQVIRESSTG